MKLMATLRSGAGVPVAMRLTGNPGGPGHQWVRARYIDPAPMGWKVHHAIPAASSVSTSHRALRTTSTSVPTTCSGCVRPARLNWCAPGSRATGSVVQWRVLPRVHHGPPRHRARSPARALAAVPLVRLGISARPFACHWWAVSDGSMHSIARGALVNYREWYGMKPGEPNVGLRMTAEAIAAGIKSREADDPQPMIGVADPAMFAEDGGPIDRAPHDGPRRHLPPGRQQARRRAWRHGRLGPGARSGSTGDADGAPMLLFFCHLAAISSARCRRCSTTTRGPRTWTATWRTTRRTACAMRACRGRSCVIPSSRSCATVGLRPSSVPAAQRWRIGGLRSGLGRDPSYDRPRRGIRHRAVV